jgi:hypothetical protein
VTHNLSERKIRTADITHAAASAAPAASFSRAIGKLTTRSSLARLADDMQQQSQSDGFAIETVQHVKNSGRSRSDSNVEEIAQFSGY